MFCNEDCKNEGLKRFHTVECDMADDAYVDNPEETGSKRFHPFDMLRALTESLVRLKFPISLEDIFLFSTFRSSHSPSSVNVF